MTEGEKNILVKYRTLEEVCKCKEEGGEGIVVSKTPKVILNSLALITLAFTAVSIITAIIGIGHPILYGITFILLGVSLYIAINAILNPVVRPEEWIISFLGEFNDKAVPGPYPLIPGITKAVSRVKIKTSQPIELFREESAPVIFADGITAKIKSVVMISIYDAYSVAYKLSVHEYFIKERQKIGVFYDPDQNYFYAIEEILDSLIRGFFGGLDIEEVLEMRAISSSATGELQIEKEIVDKIEKEADEMLSPYGIDVESILFTEIKLLEKDILEKLQEKFKQRQDKEIADLQEKVEESKVKVEAQKALQEEKKGAGAGNFLKKQIESVKKTGLPVETAANVVTTKMITDAMKGGANVTIIATSQDGKISTPVMTGIGMGIGQKTAEKRKESVKETTSSEKDKSRVEKEPKEKKRGEKQ